MKFTAILSLIIIVTSVSCAYSSVLLPDYVNATEIPTDTAVPLQRPTKTPFPDATELTELVVETSSAITPQPTETKGIVDMQGAGCIPAGQALEGTVLDVIDGATIEVDVDGRVMTVRYIGIDTSESVIDDRPVVVTSEEALQKNKELVKGKDVVMYRDVSMTDGYGRLLAYVLTDKYFVNNEMIRHGYALSASYPPDVACSDTFQQSELLAKAETAGMWSRLVE